MNPGVSLLCILVCITAASCDRVYVHPFALANVNNMHTNSCKEVEKREHQAKTFLPSPIESHIPSAPEESPGNKSEDGEKLVGVDSLVDPIYILGARFYQLLREIHEGDNIFLSPVFIYESLLSFYLGASGVTATNLQTFLGYDSPTIDPNCTYKIDGHKVFAALRSIIHCPLHPGEDDGLLFSKFSSLFTSPGIYLSESFVHELATPDSSFQIRAVNFTNPTKAAEQISAFVERKSTHKSQNSLGDIDPETNLLLATYLQVKVALKQASLLREPQEFWLDSGTKISVPMMTVTGTFEYKCDGNPGLAVVKIPVSKCVFLLLLLPTNSSTLASVEDQYSMRPSKEWLEKLSPSEINLTLPTVSFKSIYNLQELLMKQNMSCLLEKKDGFRMLSDTNVKIGKVINQQLFELSPGGADQPEESPKQNEPKGRIKITLNRPFLVIVYSRNAEGMLYIGRVTNPLKK
ncbi:Angiotensinogen [Varanus komodoensis]|uniref:angiotensinogen n=1 Tax=Varanus komodoensis TaxID=61221 RepID=UPI001CF779F3|nr:angiotensinogen [Varanus komodoensis]KAF7253502.1 Angiotensinogen [Varanus komodoensis]